MVVVFTPGNENGMAWVLRFRKLVIAPNDSVTCVREAQMKVVHKTAYWGSMTLGTPPQPFKVHAGCHSLHVNGGP
eukprot:5299623-Amphidinium_carterae.1